MFETPENARDAIDSLPDRGYEAALARVKQQEDSFNAKLQVFRFLLSTLTYGTSCLSLYRSFTLIKTNSQGPKR